MPQQEYSERMSLIITVVVVVLLVVAGGAAYFWGRTRLETIKKDIKKIDKNIIAAEERIDKIAGLEEECRKRKASSAQCLERLPDTLEIDSLMRQIAQNARDAEMQLVSLERSRTRKRKSKDGASEPYEKFTYGLELTGNYESFVNFIHRMEYEMPRFFMLQSFSIKGAHKGLVPGTREHEVSLELVTYAFARRSAPAPKKLGGRR